MRLCSVSYTFPQYVPHLWPRRKRGSLSGGFLLGEQVTLKPHLSFQDQLELLKSRRLHVADDAKAIECLSRLGYYRLAGYFYPLRGTKPPGEVGRLDTFQKGASFELVVQLYQFDKRLRLLMLDACERIEVAIRVCIAHRLGRLDPEAHLNRKLLDGKFTSTNNGSSRHEQWCARLQKAIQDSHDDFVEHHRTKYGGRMPIWVAIELWDFGLLSHFFSGLQHRDRGAIAHHFGRLQAEHLQSWLRTLNFARNVSAHHSRLWNRNVPEVPKFPGADTHPLLAHLQNGSAPYKLYGALSCAAYLLRTLDLDGDWATAVRAHIGTFPENPILSISSAGFPEDWSRYELWQRR